MKQHVFSGYLLYDDYEFLCLDEKAEYHHHGSPLGGMINEKISNGTNVFVRYYIADKPLTLAQASEALVYKSLGLGNLDARYILEAYSEYTILEWEHNAVVGGHDLLKELDTYTGKYLILVITESDTMVDDIQIPEML